MFSSPFSFGLVESTYTANTNVWSEREIRKAHKYSSESISPFGLCISVITHVKKQNTILKLELVGIGNRRVPINQNNTLITG